MKVNLIECMTTWQGEGPDTGKRMVLARFKNCDKECPYCDTMVKMRNSIEAEYDIKTIDDMCQKNKAGLLITGGEPTLYIPELISLIENTSCDTYNIETNGYALLKLFTNIPHDKLKLVKFIFSPKLYRSNYLEDAIKMLSVMGERKEFFVKIVHQDNEFQEEFLKVIDFLKLNKKTYLMPEGKTKEELLTNAPAVFDKAEEYNLNVSTRMHIMYNFI